MKLEGMAMAAKEVPPGHESMKTLHSSKLQTLNAI
jgi:hypothetical protein